MDLRKRLVVASDDSPLSSFCASKEAMSWIAVFAALRDLEEKAVMALHEFSVSRLTSWSTAGRGQ
jgi:hypothetical protein